MTILYAYLLICFGATLGYIVAALMFTARDSDSAGRIR